MDCALRFSNERRQHYLRKGIDSVEGWLATADKFLIWSLCGIQTDLGFTGSIGEIGVHHGKLFILLYLNLHEGERAFCVDVFGDWASNVDGSGKGDRSIFLANVQKFAGETAIHTIENNSLNVRETEIIEHVGRARFISIDGGHTKAITMHDLALCERCLCDHGIIIIDDYFNSMWPAVSEGVVSYFERSNPTLIPFAIGMNKLFLCRRASAPAYRNALGERCREMRQRPTQFLGSEVDVFHGYTALSDIVCYTRFQSVGRLIKRLEKVHGGLVNWISIHVRGRRS